MVVHTLDDFIGFLRSYAPNEIFRMTLDDLGTIVWIDVLSSEGGEDE